MNGAFGLARAGAADPQTPVLVKLSFNAPRSEAQMLDPVMGPGLPSARVMRGYFAATNPITSGFHDRATPATPLAQQLRYLYTQQQANASDAVTNLTQTLGDETDAEGRAGTQQSIDDALAYRTELQARGPLVVGIVGEASPAQIAAVLTSPVTAVKAVEFVGGDSLVGPSFIRSDAEVVDDLSAMTPEAHRLANQRSSSGSSDGGENDNNKAREYAPNLYNLQSRIADRRNIKKHYQGIKWEQRGTLDWYQGDDEHDRGYESQGVVNPPGPRWSTDWQGDDRQGCLYAEDDRCSGTWTSNLPDPYRDDLFQDGDYKQFAIGSANGKGLKRWAGYWSQYLTNPNDSRGEVAYSAQATRRASSADEHGYCNGNGRQDSACFFANDTTSVRVLPFGTSDRLRKAWQDE